ncbi:MAG: outer membrane beta-barrel protein [Magnetococcales bacterium]|nr:outer membrane beta-barrel protein [Magnetococcales bacterium]
MSEHRILHPLPGSIPPRRAIPGILLLLSSILGPARQGFADEPRGIPVGIFRTKPKVTLSSTWEDNIYKSENNPTHDFITGIEPEITLVTHWRKDRYQISWKGKHQDYLNHNREDRTDHTLAATAEWSPNRKTVLNVEYQFKDSHDERGAPGTGTVNPATPPNEWFENILSASAQWTSGRFRTVLDLERGFKDSQNNGQSLQDRYWDAVDLTLMFALAPKTKLLVETGLKDITYDTNPQNNSLESRILAGVTWSATAKTEGGFKIGAMHKEMDDENKPDGNGITLSSDVTWKPLSRSMVHLLAKRGFDEGETGAEHFIATDFKLDASHDIRPKIKLKGDMGFNNSDYAGSKDEDLWTAGIGLDYKLPKWFFVSGRIGHSSKNSTEADADYDSDLLTIALTGSL